MSLLCAAIYSTTAVIACTTDYQSPGDGAKSVERVAVGTRDRVEQAIRDLATRLGLDDSEIAVTSIDEVIWSDGSMGCPRSGMVYKQQLVDGSRLVLQAAGARYHYHAGAGRAYFLCDNPQDPYEVG